MDTNANRTGRAGPASVKGAIDADGHVLEPPDVWEKYIEPRYRDRAIRIAKNAEGLEIFVIDGKPSRLLPPGFAGVLGGMGEKDIVPGPERTYVGGAPFGSMDAKQRVERIEREGMSKAILYPTIGILWEAEVKDPELAGAYCRAYNRWIVDFCSDSGGRLVPIAHITLGDVDESARELERTVRAGAKGACLHPFNWQRKSPGHPDFDPFWEKAQELGVPISIHPTVDPPELSVHNRFDELMQREPFEFTWFYDVTVAQGMQQCFVSLFHHGLFERFPSVKFVVLESQAGWIGHLIDRMDEVFHGPLGATTKLARPPSEYFKRQCWISADPDEKAVRHIIDWIGADRFFWASDFPHPDHDDDYMEELAELVAPLSERARRGILWENVSTAYRLGQ
ncbi:MAG TPA: amidohydrolase family protein [Candidatus Binatia bacterium]|nr:amidohydrolase family protein [Candidatus Binatia bacterium]